MDRKNLIIVISTILFIFLLTSCNQPTNFIPAEQSDTAQSLANETLLLEKNVSMMEKSGNYSSCDIEQYYKLIPISLFFKLFEKENVVALAAHLDKDAEWFVMGEEGLVTFGGTYNGRQEIINYLKKYFLAVDIREIRQQFNLHTENKITSHVNVIGYVPATGKTFDLEFAFFFELNERGRISKIRTYYDTYSFMMALKRGGDTYIKDIKADNNYSVVPTNIDVKETIDTTYREFFEEGDIFAVLNALADDVVIVHKGAVGIFPAHGTWYGKMGFIQWVIALTSQATNVLADTTITFGTTEGNRADYYSYEAYYSPIKNIRVDHAVYHSWRLNKEGKIDQLIINPDSYKVFYYLCN